MRKKRQKQLFIVYGLIVVSICIFSMYVLYRLANFSPLTILLSVSVFVFFILCILFLVSKDIKYQKLQWVIGIAIFIASIYALQTAPAIKSSEAEYIGIDISKWNGSVTLQNAMLELDFVIIRCGYTSNIDGTTLKIDDQFEANLKQCKDLGIPYGVYYYSLANTPELAVLEANYTLSLLDGDIPPLGVFVDIEDQTYQGHLTKQEVTDVALAYIDVINKTDNRPGIYANYYWWNNKLEHNRLKPYLKWLAFYSEEYEMENLYHIHQYTDKGVVNGLPGTYDLNIAKEKFW